MTPGRPAAAPGSLGGLLARLAEAGLLVGAADTGIGAGPGRGADPATRLAAVVADSRAVVPGSLFVAVPGFRVDGHRFLGAAAAAGAVAALVERPDPAVPLRQVVVRSSRSALAHAAAWFAGDPSHRLGIVGITGTDGKTTTSFLAVAALEAAGLRTGLVGTVEERIGGRASRRAEHVTTPEAPQLQGTLAAIRAAGDAAAVVETTSHALALDRVGAVAYDAAIFTNLTHEHLDLHGTFEAYRSAKLRLFEALAPGRWNPPKSVAGRPWPKCALVNADDPSARFVERTARDAGALVLGYGAAPDAVVRLRGVEEDRAGLRVAYEAPSGAARLALRLAGRFNAHNALAVVALGEALGLDPAAVRSGLEGLAAVPGRMERIEAGQPFGVVVDYAHSPAALRSVLDQLGPVAAAGGGGLVAVFGSAGERDVAKRAEMGRIAGERCRLIVVTNEDPRGEDPEAIIGEIAAGARAAGPGPEVRTIADRRRAIAEAVAAARPGDVVLLAGKGHEATIILAEGAIPWDEAAVAREELARLGHGAAPP